jgi:hypothetical protein
MDTVPCTPIHTTLLADSQAKQIETDPNHPITHGASFSPGHVGGGLQTQTEAESAVKLTDTKRIRDFHGLCLSGAKNVPFVRYIEVPGTCTGLRHHRHTGDTEGEDLEIGAVDKLLVGELGG